MKQTLTSAREALGLLGCIAVGLVLRMLALSSESAWCDEVLSAACLPEEGLHAYVQCAFERDPTIRLAPLYHVVQFTWAQLFGGGLYSLRMLSVSLSVVAMIQIYVLARAMTFRPAAARFAVLLFVLSLFHIYFAQEVRVYALANVWAIGAMAGLWHYASTTRQRGLWVCAGCNLALLMTHSVMGVLIGAQGLAALLLLPRTQALRWYVCQGAVVAVYVVWLVVIGYNIEARAENYSGPVAGIRELVGAALQFCGARFSNANPASYLPGALNLELAILLLVVGLVAWCLIRAARPAAGEVCREQRRAVMLLLAWLVVPAVLLLVVSHLWRPFFFTRYLAPCAIALLLLTAMGVDALPRTAFRRAAALALVSMLLWQNLALPRPFRADYGAVARVVAQDNAPEKSVLALKEFNYLAVDYALRNMSVDVELLYGLKEITGIARQRALAGKSVWAVFYRWREFGAFEEAMREAGLTFRSFDSAGMPPLTVYHVARGGTQ